MRTTRQPRPAASGPLLCLCLCLLSPSLVLPAGAQVAEPAVLGFADKDGDGANDLFRDANGDGVNDIDGRAYPHRFGFADKDGDGTNDLFRDANGDGVNDIDSRYRDADGDGVADNVVDANGDRINDITGQRYSRRSLMGKRLGKGDEDRLRFIDEDGDGIYDGRGPHDKKPVDRFVDEDGDGIYDGRRLQGKKPALDRLRQRRPPPKRRPPPRAEPRERR